jgi:hypothetical protein
MSPLEARTVLRAADIVGGLDRLAARLGARGEDLEAWLAGTVAFPEHIYQRCVDIVVACLLQELCPSHATTKGSLH